MLPGEFCGTSICSEAQAIDFRTKVYHCYRNLFLKAFRCRVRPVIWGWSARLPREQAVRWRTTQRIEAGLVLFVSVDGALHSVVDLQDDPLGAVLAVLR